MVAESRHSVADDVATDPIIRRGAIEPYNPMGAGSIARRDSQIRRAPSSSGLYDVLDLILDKGIVVDAFVRVSLVGIELITIDLRVVIASVDTYLRYAEGAERLQLYKPRGGEDQLPDMMGMNKGSMLTKGVNKLSGKGSGGDEQGGDEGVGEKLAGGVRHVLKHGVGRIMERLSGEGSGDDQGGDDEKRQARSGNGKHERRPDKLSKREKARGR